MRVAICDDEKNELDRMAAYINKFDASIEAYPFSSAADLLREYRSKAFEIVLMDIEMQEPNGYAAAEMLVSNDNPPLVIFITKSNDYAIRGYGIAFRYLKKPVSYLLFCKTFQLALDEVSPQRLPITIDGCTKVLRVRDIIYFEIFNHELLTHTIHGNFVCRMALSEIMQQFDAGHFAQPHKSYYVNLTYIDYIEKKSIVMTNGDVIPLSALRREQFISRLRSFMRGT